MQWLAKGGELDPVAHGAAMQRTREAQGELFPCPYELYHEIRADQLVADCMRGTTLQARELAETNLPLYEAYHFAQAALEEAKPIAEEYAHTKAENKRRNQEVARARLNGMGRR